MREVAQDAVDDIGVGDDGDDLQFDVASTGVGRDLAAWTATAALLPNAPNPFNPLTTLQFELKAPAHARLGIYDSAGHRVRLLLDAPLLAGRSCCWNSRPPGPRPRRRPDVLGWSAAGDAGPRQTRDGGRRLQLLETQPFMTSTPTRARAGETASA
jgi:hypothetical protein